MSAHNATDNITQLHDIEHLSEGRPEEEDNNYRSPLDWFGKQVRLNTKKEETGGSEVVKITFARNIEQPPVTQDSKDSDAIEKGSEFTAVLGWLRIPRISQICSAT
jgi:hypothetical protein